MGCKYSQNKCEDLLPENVYIDDTMEECEGNYQSTKCILVNGLEGTEEFTPINEVISELQERVKELEQQLNNE